jgi:RHS repeat-associated protein
MTFDHRGRRREYLEVAANGMTNSLKHFTCDNYLQIANCNLQLATYNSQLFVWDPTEPVATRPLAFYQPNVSPQLYAHDDNKNVSELVSADNGTITAHYEYASFGDMILTSGDLALANPFRFSSEYSDDALGLVYYNYRHLEPVTGRWMQRDSVEIEAEPNLLSFMNNMNFGWDILGERYGNPVSGPSGFPEGPSSPYDPGGPYDPDGPNWWSKLPHCPCTILLNEDGCPLIAFDGEDWTAPTRTRHWGGTWEIRSMPQDKYGPGQQCVYDAKGNLINDGPGAGTPDKVSPGGIGPTIYHILNDGWQYLISTSFDHLTHPPDYGCDANGSPCPINNGFANPPPKNLCCEK